MFRTTWVSAIDLDRWANESDARFSLPQLIRRLVLASTSQVSKLDFASGEEVSRPGYDGNVLCKIGTAWIPAGASVWEMGVNGGFKAKAESDFQKRQANPGPIDPKATTWVFVTPRDWQDREIWRKDKASLGFWADVRVLDSSDLAQWLDATPSVAAWAARLLGKRPDGVSDLTVHWENVRELSSPELSPEVFLAGRQSWVETLDEWLDKSASAIYVQSDSADEVIDAFAAFAHHQAGKQRDFAQARCLIVESREAWRSLAATLSPLILIPNGFPIEPQLVSEATRRGHHVLVPVSRNTLRSATVSKLHRLKDGELRQALTNCGFDDAKAKQLARESAGRSTVLKRLVSKSPTKTPDWAAPEVAPKLAPFLLVGGWDENKPADRTIVSRITGLSESEIQALVRQWSKTDDPLFAKTERGWKLISRTDSWRWLCDYLAQDAADAYAASFNAVVGEDDPRFELAPEQRLLASVYGKVPTHSTGLRRGMVEALTLLMVSVDGNDDLPSPPVSIKAWQLFDTLFPPNASWQRWASLGENLSLLAEAMPDAFLDILDRELVAQPGELGRLFAQDNFFSGSPMLGLVWALEIVGWDPNYLLRVATVLAKLSRLDPGGNMNPRPIGALGDFFFPLFPQTTATPERRLEVLDEIIRTQSDIAWKLLLMLLPPGAGTLLHNSQPRWRSWAKGWSGLLGRKEATAQTNAIADRIVTQASGKPDRLIELLDHVSRFRATARRRLFDAFSKLNVTQLSDADRERLLKPIRQIIHYQSSAPNSRWNLSEESLAILSDLVVRLQPQDLGISNRWLFEPWPELPGFTIDTDHKVRDAAIIAARQEAYRKIFQAGGINAVFQLTEESKEAWAVGYIAGKENLPPTDESRIFPHLLDSENPKLATFAHCYVRAKFESGGWIWVETLSLEKWSHEQIACLGRALPFDSKSWDWIARHGDAVSVAYWNQSWGYNRALTITEHERAIREWLKASRTKPAVELLAFLLHDNLTLDPALVAESLNTWLAQSLSAELLRDEFDQGGHRIGKLVEFLQNSPSVLRSDVAAFEWQLLPLLERSHVKPRALFAELSENSSLFVDLIGAVVAKRKAAETDALTDGERSRAFISNQLLELWATIPGTQSDGSIDAAYFLDWANKARELAQQRDIVEVCEFRIGELLSESPPGTDEIWPCEAVRQLIEEWRSERLESGLSIERFNRYQPNSSRHEVPEKTWQELAAKHRRAAEKLAGRWLRTAALLRDLTSSYDGTARRRSARQEEWDEN